MAEEPGDVRLTAFRREVAGGFVVVVLAARIGSLREEELHDGGGHGVGTGCKHQRRITAEIARRHVGPVFEQETHDGFVARGAGVAQGGFVALGRGAGVGAVGEQQADGGHAAAGGRQHERGLAGIVLGIDGCFRGDEQPQRFLIAADGGGHQGRAAVGDLEVGIGAVFEEQPEDGVAVAERGRQIERRAAVALFRIHSGTTGQQHADLRKVGRGPVQRRGAAAVLRVHVGPGVGQPGEGLERTKSGRVVQQRRASPIRRRQQIRGFLQQFFDGGAGSRPDGRDQGRELRIERRRRGFSGDIVAEVRALIDPRAQQADFGDGQFGFRRHHIAAVAVDELVDEPALRALPGHNDRAIIAAAERVLPEVESEAGLLLAVAVALVAVLLEQRLDVLEVVDLFRGGRRQRKLRGEGRRGEE